MTRQKELMVWDTADGPIARVQWVSFETLLAEPLRNGIYKEKQFHGRGAKIVNMGELYSHPRLRSSVGMKRVELTAKEIDRTSLLADDLIFARRSLTAEGAGKCSIILSVEPPTTFESSIIRARLDKTRANPLFYYYYFNSAAGKQQLGTILRQVAVAGITGSDLARLQVPVILKEEQDRIASLLGGLDDKIELNSQINQTLEQMAQTIFQSWFVDFEPVKAKVAALAQGRDPLRAAMCAMSGKTDAELDELPGEQFDQLAATATLFPEQMVESEMGEIPEGWTAMPLDVVANYLNGLALQKFPPESPAEWLPVIKIAQLKKGEVAGADRASANLRPEYTVNDGDILFSWSGSLEVDIWCGGTGALNQHLFKVTSDSYPKWFYYHWTREHLNHFQNIAAGKAVTMGHIQRRHLTAALCATPPDSAINGLGCLLSNLMDQTVNDRIEARILADLRDVLLPKLLSGELSIVEVANA